jgi:hypothetical protein
MKSRRVDAPPKGKRGGKRSGAGRPPNLTAAHWVALGDAIERRIVEKMNSMLLAGVSAQIGENRKLLMLLDTWEVTRKKIVALPPQKRRMNPKTIEKHAKETRDEIEASGLRYHLAPTKVPQGIVGPAIESVRRELSCRWNVRIGSRTAQECWKWHQESMRRLRKGGEHDYVPTEVNALTDDEADAPMGDRADTESKDV